MGTALLAALLPSAAPAARVAAEPAATSTCSALCMLGPATPVGAGASAAGNSLDIRRTLPASWPARCPCWLRLRLRLRRLGVPAMPVTAAALVGAGWHAAGAAAAAGTPVCGCACCCLSAGPSLLPLATAALGLSGGVMLLQLAKLQLLARLPARGDSPGGGSRSSWEGAGEVPRDSCTSRCCRPWCPLPFLPLPPGCCGAAAAPAAVRCVTAPTATAAVTAGCFWGWVAAQLPFGCPLFSRGFPSERSCGPSGCAAMLPHAAAVAPRSPAPPMRPSQPPSTGSAACGCEASLTRNRHTMPCTAWEPRKASVKTAAGSNEVKQASAAARSFRTHLEPRRPRGDVKNGLQLLQTVTWWAAEWGIVQREGVRPVS